MSKDFVILNTARKLESYVSRERYNIDKMRLNDRVPTSLYETKAQQFNELLDVLNSLYGTLIDGASELFDEHYIDLSDGDDDTYDDTYSVIAPSPVEYVPAPSEPEVVTILKAEAPAPEVTPEPEQMQWQLDGFDSYDAWVALKDAEASEISDDLDVSVSVEASKHKLDAALDEYDTTKTQDISDYDAEADRPPDALGAYNQDESSVDDDTPSDSETEPLRVTEGLEYLHYTHDNIRVDDDPTQIASVKTAVEVEGEDGYKSVDLDLDSFVNPDGDQARFDTSDILSADLAHYGDTSLSESDDYSDDDYDDNDAYDNDDDEQGAFDDEDYDLEESPDDFRGSEPPENSLFVDTDPDADISDDAFDRVNDAEYINE